MILPEVAVAIMTTLPSEGIVTSRLPLALSVSEPVQVVGPMAAVIGPSIVDA